MEFHLMQNIKLEKNKSIILKRMNAPQCYKAEEVLNGINKKVAAIRCMARNADK